MNKDKKESILKESQLNNVANMRKSNLDFLINFLENNNYLNTILEIGTGCGYSSYCLSEITSVKKITTIEKNIKRYEIAKKLLKNESKINILNKDANVFFNSTNINKYDVIILDGPKNKLIWYIERSFNFLNKNGICVVDNLFLKDIRKKQNEKFQKRYEKLIIKNNELQNYINLLDKKRYNIFVDESGDGLVIIQLL
ncbi:O-methyltransferase [Mycoplasmoides pirum]|uniref:O-methyltransferase n=1 Tax=Mycoplasmoides pirum TaxID=2122 RepID=UPI0004858DC2|nr:rRNA adenine N-6-methyltransferase family protein [Mycoplasmoides pirum]